MVDAVLERMDASIRVLFYILIFWLPYSPAVVETAVILAILVWIVKRSFILKNAWNKSLSVFEQFHTIARAFKPKESVLTSVISFFLLVCLLSALGGLWPGKSLHGILTKTLEWFIIFYLIIRNCQ